MKKKLVISSIFISFLLFSAAVVFVGYSVYVFLVYSNMARGSNYMEDELSEYAQDKFGRTIDIVDWKLGEDDDRYKAVVHVKTLDRQGFKFLIRINKKGEVANDNYQELITRDDVNNRYKESEEIKALQAIGFSSITIGNEVYEEDLAINLPEDIQLFDPAAFEILYDSLPIIHQLNEKITADTGYPLEVLSVNDKWLDLTKSYGNVNSIGQEFARESPEIFYPNFYNDDLLVLQDGLEDLEETILRLRLADANLSCYELKDFESCKHYEVVIDTTEQEDGSVFHTNEKEDLDGLLLVIHRLQKIDLPIDRVSLFPVLVIAKAGVEQDYRASEVFISPIDDVKTVRDIRFQVR
ncbi:hypothetical protein DVB69_14620 [Sporosarcina sp. BI001-red]|uniref:hypothetical protein n=1 Tax=Sporosarcina sp. BI001-red TaxID=2282866 RepID=UPI000E253DDA|nr:hypothetical protein [Sporosarcina sp. BI001-red]REB05506.1 hypothetical protein DVB69_14620 [Sporosarcina sp. BI001-red]